MSELYNRPVIRGDWIVYGTKWGLSFGRVIYADIDEMGNPFLSIVPVRDNWRGDYYYRSRTKLYKADYMRVDSVPKEAYDALTKYPRYKEFWG